MGDAAEASALRWSAIGYAGMGVLGLTFAQLADSAAIQLDGFYSVLSCAMALVALRVSRLVEEPDSDDFPFGFSHFEPLLNVLRIFLILGIGGFALVSAVLALFSGGRELQPGYALVYGLLAATLCLVFARLQAGAARRVGSPLLEVDARNWFVDGMLSSGVAVAFLLAFLISGSRFADWLPYADPLLVTVLVLAMVPVPIRGLRANLAQVFGVAPNAETQREVRERIRRALEEVEPDDLAIRMLPTGRFLYLLIHVVLPAEEPRTLAELDAIRARIWDALDGLSQRPILDVSFTGDERWLRASGPPDPAEGRL